MNVEESWKTEDEISIEERRSRYRCEKYLTKENITSWASIGFVLYPHKTEKEQNSTFGVNVDFNQKVALFFDEITNLEIDAIVIPTNESLFDETGISGLVHRNAGDKLREECFALATNICSVGETKITRGYNLPAKYVLHTVLPNDQNLDLFKSCYQSSLELVSKHNIRSVAFCGFSVFSMRIALEIVRKWLEHNINEVDSIIFCIPSEEKETYQSLMTEFFPLDRPIESFPPQEEITVFKEENISSQEEAMPSQKETTPTQEENISIQLENKSQENTLIQENAPLQEENSLIQEENTLIQEENKPLQEENTLIQEENTPLQEENISVQAETLPLQTENALPQEEITPVQTLENKEFKIKEIETNRGKVLEEEARKNVKESQTKLKKKSHEIKKLREELQKKINIEREKSIREEATKKQKEFQEKYKLKDKKKELEPTTKKEEFIKSIASMYKSESSEISKPPPKDVLESIPKWQLISVPLVLLSFFAIAFLRYK
jgi:O-acetyl-ADP-ribose deacetylase (regulator of RNase III)